MVLDELEGISLLRSALADDNPINLFTILNQCCYIAKRQASAKFNNAIHKACEIAAIKFGHLKEIHKAQLLDRNILNSPTFSSSSNMLNASKRYVSKSPDRHQSSTAKFPLSSNGNRSTMFDRGKTLSKLCGSNEYL